MKLDETKKQSLMTCSPPSASVLPLTMILMQINLELNSLLTINGNLLYNTLMMSVRPKMVWECFFQVQVQGEQMKKNKRGWQFLARSRHQNF